MPENPINYKIGGDKQLVFLSTERLIGIQSVSISQNPGLQNLSYAGIGADTVKYIPQQEQSAALSLNSFLINKDYFMGLVTGNSLSNMYIMREKNDFNTNYSLISGYFNKFSCSYSIGNVPEVSTNAVFLYDAGEIGTGSMPFSAANQLNTISNSNVEITGNLLIPYSNSISLSLDDLINTNRVQSFRLDINADKKVVYNMGSKFPKRVDTLSSDVVLNISFEVGSYDAKRLRIFTQSGVIRNLNLTLADYSTNQTVCNYSFSGLTLTDEAYETSINNNIIVNQNYQTKIYN